ncbi:USO1 family protein [Megaselia abdita]
MDFFKSGLKTVLGTSSDEGQDTPTGAETVEKLVDRVTSSTLLDDRRDACRALKALSRKYRIEVGAQGMQALVQVLQSDRADCEIVSYALDTLCNIVTQEQFEEESDNPTVSMNVGEQFTEMFIKQTENVSLVLDYLEEYDFKVRWAAVKLLTTLLTNRTKDIQEIILVSPMAVSKLMDLLIDSREVIRNDALLLLIQLTKINSNIQKIVAFENAFDRVFDIVRDEGFSDGGIVVEDCFILLINLLKHNTSNQQFFKEGSYIQKISPMFKFGSSENEEQVWTPQKVSNVHCMLQIVRSLVSPSNQQQVILSCQKTMKSCGLLEALCNILMGSGVPADILTETINTVGEVVRGETENQLVFSNVMAPSNPPKSALVVLLMSMINEKQPLILRISVLYSFQCFLYKNETGQNSLIQTLLPSSNAEATITTGQLLCGGLFSMDPLANWFSSVALMHGLISNREKKEQLLRVLLATTPGSPPVSLLQQCCSILQQNSCKLQTKVGILMLLSVWLNDCPVAVNYFLSSPSNGVSYLIAEISSNEQDENEYLIQGLCAFLLGLCIQGNDNTVMGSGKEDLCQLVVKRIGLEIYTRKLGEVSRHESYSRAGKNPQIRVDSGSDLLLDYEFCKVFKALEHTISALVNGYSNNNTNMTELTLSSEASDLVGQYKGIIRDLDKEIKSLKVQVNDANSSNSDLRQRIVELEGTNSQLADQNILLKAQLTASSISNGSPNDSSVLNLEIGRLQQENHLLQSKLAEEKDKTSLEMDKLRKDQEDLLELLSDQENKITKLKNQLKASGLTVEDDDELDEESDGISIL